MERSPTTVRACSAALFGGAQYRLEVCAALQPGETVTAVALMERLPVPPTKASVHMEIQRLTAAGLLLRLTAVAGDRHAYFRVSSSSFWQAAREILAAASDISDRPVAPLSPLILNPLFTGLGS